jgi:hypothetical protein
MRIERALVRAIWRLLIWRGWIVQLNTPDQCRNVYEDAHGRRLDSGWSPYFSVRFGMTAVFREPSKERISRSQRRLWEAQVAEIAATQRSRAEAGLDA